jgi:hypothetical protein
MKQLLFLFAVVGLGLAGILACDRLDQTDIKRQPFYHQPNSSLNDSGHDDSELNADVGNDEALDVDKGPPPVATASGYDCQVTPFRQTLRGALRKAIPITFFSATVQAQAQLGITNRANDLELDLSISELEVSPGFARSAVNSNLSGLVGKRNLTILENREREALSKRRDVWANLHCDIALVSKYRIPYGENVFVTIDFHPALPWAIYPEKLDEQVKRTIGNGLTYTNISARVSRIEGQSQHPISVGETIQGRVTLTQNNNVVRFVYDFGERANLGKFGLFESAAYRLEGGAIQQLDVRSVIMQGRETVDIRFE